MIILNIAQLRQIFGSRIICWNINPSVPLNFILNDILILGFWDLRLWLTCVSWLFYFINNHLWIRGIWLDQRIDCRGQDWFYRDCLCLASILLSLIIFFWLVSWSRVGFFQFLGFAIFIGIIAIARKIFCWGPYGL